MKISESKRKKFTLEKLLDGAKKVTFKSTATRTAITLKLIIIYRKIWPAQQRKKRKTLTKRNVSRRPEPSLMLKIEEEKRAIPCEKDTSVILACLGSGMKWFGKDKGE